MRGVFGIFVYRYSNEEFSLTFGGVRHWLLVIGISHRQIVTLLIKLEKSFFHVGYDYYYYRHLSLDYFVTTLWETAL